MIRVVMCCIMLCSRRVHDVTLYLCYIFCFSSPSSFHHLPLPSLLCCPYHSTHYALHSITLLPPLSFLTLIILPHTTPHCTPSHYITSVCATLSDVKKKNGSDDGSEDAPPTPQKPVKGVSKQTWGAKSKGTVMCAFCYSILFLLICSCQVYPIFFSLLSSSLLFSSQLTPPPFTLNLLNCPT